MGWQVNKAIQPILARLTALSTPAQLAPGGARVIADIGHPNPMAALLREVNETILGRSLRVESSGGSSLTLDIAGRRVLRLSDATGVSGAERCLAAETLEDEHKDELILVMQAVAARRHELRVTSLPLTGGGDGVSVGLPVALLADLLLIDLNETASAEAEPVEEPPAAPVVQLSVVRDAVPDPAPDTTATETAPSLVAFAEQVGPALTAWLVQGGGETGASEGPEEMVAHLRGFIGEEAASVHAQLDRVADRPGGRVCLILGATLVDGHSVACARVGEGLLLGVVEGDATIALLRAWAEVMA